MCAQGSERGSIHGHHSLTRQERRTVHKQRGNPRVFEKKKRCAGWRPCDKEARTDFKKAVVDQKGDVQPEDLGTIQRGIEEAAEKITHTAPDRQEEVRNAPEEVTVREGAAARCSGPIERKVLIETSQESQGRACSEMQLDVGQKNIEKKNL